MKYSDFGYMCIFDELFNIIWSDNQSLFNKLRRRKASLLKRFNEANRSDTIYYEFTVDKIKYLAKMNMLYDKRIVCRVSREVPDDAIDRMELLEDIDNIRHSSLNAISAAQMIKGYISKSDSDTAKDLLRANIGQMSNIYSDCLNIMLLFEEDGKKRFICLEKYLMQTFDRMKFVLRKMRKSFTYLMCIDDPYWKLDYRHLEMALFNLVKIMLVSTVFGDSGLITIRSQDSGVLFFTAEFPFNQNYSLLNSRLEMRTVCHLFRLMNGKAEFYQEFDRFVCTGYIMEESAREIRSAPYLMQLKTDLNREKINKRSKNGDDTYYSLYRKPQRSYFKSGEYELEDITDPNIKFIELFFMDVDYNE